LDGQFDTVSKEVLIEEIKKLRVENKKLSRQFNLANDNMRKYKSVTIAKENVSAVIAAEKSKQEKHLQVIMEHTPDVIILLDSAMNFLLSTQSFFELIGVPNLRSLHHKSFGQVFAAFASDAWIARMEGIFKKALETNTTQSFDEELCIGAPQNARSYTVRVLPFVYSGDTNDGILVSFHDITERMEMENKIREALADATAASKAKSDFLANMSHEIRTPMNAIIGMTTVGKSSGDIDRKDYCLDKIESASNHLLGVINDILDMSKIESGKFTLSEAPFDFEKMFQQVANVISFRAEEKKHKFAIYIDRDIPQIMIGDDQRLAQVITNLLGNAIKFTPDEGTVRIRTFLLNEEGGECTIKISVSDTGIGINPEQQAKLFQSFYQAESSTSRKFGGTGLGLMISKNIVEMMGGEIWVESEIGRGSTFSFTAKVKRGAVLPRALSVSGEELKKTRILVVDDDLYILNDFKGIAEKLGVSCDVAGDGGEALRLIERNGGYDICFVDWEIPETGGVKLTREIIDRAPGQNDSLVIMVSFVEYSRVAAEASEFGIDRFMQKPLFPSTITSIIDGYLGVKAQNKDEAGADISGIFEGRRILLAEDVDINREIVISLLEPTRLCIDCAVNGAEAVRMFGGAPGLYDMIFMDLQMPEMDGYEAARAIRALGAPEAKTVPIVAMTANVFKEDVDNCLKAGMDGHIGKPIDFDEVVKTLNIYLKNRR